MELEAIEAHCRELAYQGVEYEDIRRELEQFELSPEERRRLLDKTDEFIVQFQLHQQHKSQALIQMMLGGVVMAAGLAALIGTYLSGGSRYSLSLAVMVAGAWIWRKGNEKYRAPMRDYDIRGPKKPSKFHRF